MLRPKKSVVKNGDTTIKTKYTKSGLEKKKVYSSDDIKKVTVYSKSGDIKKSKLSVNNPVNKKTISLPGGVSTTGLYSEKRISKPNAMGTEKTKERSVVRNGVVKKVVVKNTSPEFGKVKQVYKLKKK
jgi:hypothetical protein